MPRDSPRSAITQEQRITNQARLFRRAFYSLNMCGRYTVVSKLEIIEKRFQAKASFDAFLNPNIALGDEAPVITSENPKQIQAYRFGLQPHWAQKSMILINARSEGDHNPDNQPNYRGAMGIINKPAFRKPIRQQRCLIIADAFIEGPTVDRLNKPFLIYPTDPSGPFAFAGIWDEWMDLKTGQKVRGFSIITAPPFPIVAQIGHHRSPVVLRQEDEQLWLHPQTDLADITALLKQNIESGWNAYPLAKDIKSARDKSIDLLAPIGDALLPTISYNFTQQLVLQGMGASPSRSRRNDENNQLSLF